MPIHNTSQIVITIETREAYLKKADGLVTRYRKECEFNLYRLDEGFIHWLESRKKDWVPTSWRANKSSMIEYFKINKYPELVELLMSIGSEGCKPTRGNTNTSSRKKKSITKNEEELIIADLSRRKSSNWAQITLSIFRAGILVGLRPIEWISATMIYDMKLEDGTIAKHVLRVKNAKHTNGRSHGKYRHLILDDFTPKELKSVTNQISAAKRIYGKDGFKTYENYLSSCDTELRRTISKLFPRAKKKITLYSCRHQFSANLKQAGYSRIKIATLMGHAVDDTASEHYGRKRSGRKGRNLPKALKSEMKRIRINTDCKKHPSLSL